MCGIGGVIEADRHKSFKKEAKLISLSLLLELQPRGDDAWGIYLEKTKNNRGLYCEKKDASIVGQLFKTPGAVKDFFNYNSENEIFLNDVHTFLMHTRMNTQGHPEINENNHPFNTKDFILAHNGNLIGLDALKTKYKIKTDIECDSYILAHMIQANFDKSKSEEYRVAIKEAILKSLQDAKPVYACWLYYKPKKEIYLFRNTNPIYYYHDSVNELFVFASEDRMIAKAYGKSELENPTPTLLPGHKIYQLDGDILREVCDIPYDTIDEEEACWGNRRGRTFDGTDSPIKLSADVEKLNRAFERLFLECERHENPTTKVVEFAIAIIQDGIRVLVRPDALITRLDTAGFDKFKKIDKGDTNDYCHYIITPPEKIITLMDNYDILNNPKSKERSSKKWESISPELLDALEDLGDTLECEMRTTDSHIIFIFQSTPPPLASGLFQKIGAQPNKFNMVRIERSPSNLSKIKLLLRDPLKLYEGE